MIEAPRTKLLTFQSWVTNWAWYLYAVRHPERVPFLLLDRSPCQDPFFDPFAPSPVERRPLISGLCRLLQNFHEGTRFIYITRPDNRVCRHLGMDGRDTTSLYFGVAALVVERVWPSHEEAASEFLPRRYVADPTLTPYPPNLAHRRQVMDLERRIAELEAAVNPAGEQRSG